MKDIVSTIGTVGALIIASFGLYTWRRQLKGTSQYEVAKKVMLLTYQVCDAIQVVRHPLVYLSKAEVESGRKLEEEIRIYEERLTILNNKWVELRAAVLEAKAIWGIEAESQFDILRKVIGELRAAIWLHFWMKGAYAGPGATIDNNQDRVFKNDMIVYYTSDSDEFSEKVNAAVKVVEVFFAKRLRG